jgi:glycosyltransferase involved in cell wall biosynthesis
MRDGSVTALEPFDIAAWRSPLPQRERAPHRVLCVAHLYPRKHVMDLIRAWPAVVSTVGDAWLDIAGDGPELRRLVHAARDVPRCSLHGHLETPGLRELYARCGVFCLPSAQETFGYAVVEALASGLPVVVADAGALPEVVGDAVARTVPVNEPEAIANALIDVIEDEAVRTEAAAVNPQRAAAFDSSAVSSQMVSLLHRVLDQRRVGGSASRANGVRR